MENNLPFRSLPLVDKPYNNHVIPFLSKLDDGNVFKRFILIFLTLLSFILLLGGLYLSISGLFGDSGFISNYLISESISIGDKVGAGIGMIVGLAFSIILSWLLYSVVKKRTKEMEELKFENIIDFIFIKFFPKCLLLIGEILFLSVLYLGILQIVSALAGSSVYAPIYQIPEILLGSIPYANLFSIKASAVITSNYDYFSGALKLGFITSLSSFFLLIAFYIYKEIYCFILKLANVFIQFLPKFALPIALRKRNEN